MSIRKSPAQTRISGLLLADGAVAWSVGTVIVGDRVQEGVQTLDTVTGMVSVAGLLAFVWTVHVTRSAGDGWTRVIPVGLMALLPGAFVANALSFGGEVSGPMGNGLVWNWPPRWTSSLPLRRRSRRSG